MGCDVSCEQSFTQKLKLVKYDTLIAFYEMVNNIRKKDGVNFRYLDLEFLYFDNKTFYIKDGDKYESVNECYDRRIFIFYFDTHKITVGKNEIIIDNEHIPINYLPTFQEIMSSHQQKLYNDFYFNFVNGSFYTKVKNYEKYEYSNKTICYLGNACRKYAKNNPEFRRFFKKKRFKLFPNSSKL